MCSVPLKASCCYRKCEGWFQLICTTVPPRPTSSLPGSGAEQTGTDARRLCITHPAVSIGIATRKPTGVLGVSPAAPPRSTASNREPVLSVSGSPDCHDPSSEMASLPGLCTAVVPAEEENGELDGSLQQMLKAIADERNRLNIRQEISGLGEIWFLSRGPQGRFFRNIHIFTATAIHKLYFCFRK